MVYSDLRRGPTKLGGFLRSKREKRNPRPRRGPIRECDADEKNNPAIPYVLSSRFYNLPGWMQHECKEAHGDREAEQSGHIY